MSSIITLAITMLTAASGEYMKSLYIGTPCECNVSTTYHTYIYDLKASPHFGDGGECKGESEDPLDVWNGLGVEFYGNAGKSSHYPTFEYTIDCALPCVIMRVDIAGKGWCSGGGAGNTKLKITGSDANGDLPKMYGQINMGPNPDTKVVEESGIYSCDLGSAESSIYGVCSVTPDPRDLAAMLLSGPKQRFRIEDTDDICLEGVESGWRCRKSLSIWATTSVDEPAVCGGSCNKTSEVTSSTSTTPPTTTSTTDSRDSIESSHPKIESSHPKSSSSSSDPKIASSHPKSDSKSKSSSSSDPKSSSSSSDSKSSSSDSSDLSDSKSSSSDSNDDLSAIALRYEKCSSRVKELEAWTETLLSMTAAKNIQGEEVKNEKDEGSAPSTSTNTNTSAPDVFGVEEALIVCLVLTNTVLLAYACKKHMGKHEPVYAGVLASAQEDV